MLKPVAMMALSLSLVTLAAGPALAQARRPVAEPQPSVATLSAFAKPKFEFSLLGGYRWMAGAPFNLGTTTSFTATTANTSTNPANPPVTTTVGSTSDTVSTLSTSDVQAGFSVSGSATYWLDSSFGLGLDYTFANTAAKLDSYHTLGLGTGDTLVKPDTDPSDGLSTSTKATQTTIGFNGNSVQLNNNPTIRGIVGAADYMEFKTTKAAVSGFTGLSWILDNGSEVGLAGPTSTFVNTEGAVAESTTPNAPTNQFTATGKIGGTQDSSTTMNMVDALTKTVIGANARGELHLLAGVSVPMFMTRTTSNSTITGADGTGVATQTVVHRDSQTPDNNFTQVISVEASEKADSSTSSTMVGPMIGLGGIFKVSDAVHLYGKFGYTPIMMGTAVQSSTSTTHQKVSRTYTEAGTAAAAGGKVVGSVATIEGTNTVDNGDTRTSFVGRTASTFVLGARFRLAESLGLVVEGVNQNVSGVGYAGVNAGLNFAF